VSLVIPTFNSSAFLPTLIAALELLDPAPSEVVFVDDCSSDGLPRNIDGMLGKAALSCRVKVVLRDTNGGSSAARNDGLDVASGDIVAFCDSDDLPLPHRIGVHQVDLSHRTRGAVSYGAIAGFQHGHVGAKYVRGGWRYRRGEKVNELIRRNFVPFSTVAVSGEVRSLRFEGRRYNEDWYYLIETARHFDLVTQRVPLTVYRYSDYQKSQYFSRKDLLGSYDELEDRYRLSGEKHLAQIASRTRISLAVGGPVASLALLYRELIDYLPSRLRDRTKIDSFLLKVHTRALTLEEGS
jgi:glycosyltransferase involved in cell wall biosynthesis